MSESKGDLSRRDLLWIAGGVAGANLLGAATWGGLELMVKSAGAATWHKSVCRFCGTGCGIQVAMDGGKITDVRGDELAHNKGVICEKGAMLRALPYLSGRLTTPKIKRNGKFVEASWDEAMALVADTFKRAIAESGPDSVAFYGSGSLFTEESYTANKLFKAGLRTNNVDGNPRLCMASAAVGYTQVYGKDEPPGSYEDADYATFFFLIGANPFECHPPIFERIRRRKAQDPRVTIVCVDPRRTLTAERSDVHLAPVPGTDLLLLNSMAQVICEQGLADTGFVEKHVRFSDGTNTVAFEDFRKFLDASYKPEAVEKELGIAAYQIREVAFSFARAKATMSLWTMGINQRTQGTFLNNMLNGLHLLTGQICRPGATPFSLAGQGNACGGVRDTGSLSHLLPNGRQVANEKHRAEMEQIWGVPAGTISPKPGYDTVSLFRAMEDGRVKACLVMCTNPAQSMPAVDRYRAAMDKCFLVVAEAFEDSETAKLADVLLPAAVWVEKEGVLGQSERRYQLLEKLIDPPGLARSDLQILVDLAQRLGYADLIKAHTSEEVWDEWREISAKSVYNFRGITRARLEKERGLQWPCPDETHPGTVRRYVEGDDPFVSKGAGIEFYGAPDKRAVIFLRPYVPSPEMPTTEFPLVLTTGRYLEQWHTGTMTMRIEELRKATGDAMIEIHEQDAWPLKIQNGDTVELKSRYGTMQGKARLTQSPRPGVLFASFYDAKLLINRIVADYVDPTSKEPEYKITAVALRKVSA